MRSAIVLALAAAVGVNAQSSTSSASSAIPTDVTSGCSSFLSALNSNSSLTSCLSPLLSAASAFSPSNSSNSSVSQDTVKSTLSSLCSASVCDDTFIRYQLSSMYSACGSDMTGSNSASVLRIYDVLYTLLPMRNAVCTKDDSGNYCVLSVGASTSSASASALASSDGSKAASSGPSDASNLVKQVMDNLYMPGSAFSKRDDSSLLVPNTTTFSLSYLPFLFLSASTPSSTLCSTCTRNVITAYTAFEQASPYALGIANSPLLNEQTALYDAVQSLCGSSFLSGAVQAAGGLSGSIVNGESSAGERINVKEGVLGMVLALGGVLAVL